jgi:hypothetical protein
MSEKIKINVGDTLYFFEMPNIISKRNHVNNVIGEAIISKIGRKFVTFSSFDGRTEDYILKDYRYNIEDESIEYLWGKGEWRLLAKTVHHDLASAAAAREQQLLCKYLLAQRKESALRSIPLHILRQLDEYVDLTLEEKIDLVKLRAMQDRRSIDWATPDNTWLEKLVESGQVYREIDGYYVFDPKPQGFFEAGDLRLVADKLDSLNQKWDCQVQADLASIDIMLKE